MVDITLDTFVFDPATDVIANIDGQNTFGSKGELAVADAEAIIDPLRDCLLTVPRERRVASQDMHPKRHCAARIAFRDAFLEETFVPEVGLSILTPRAILQAVVAGTPILDPETLFGIQGLQNYLDGLDRLGKAQPIWPEHALVGTRQVDFLPGLDDIEYGLIWAKGMDTLCDSNGAFTDNLGRSTGFDRPLRRAGVKRFFAGGLVRRICVAETLKGAIQFGFEAIMILDATVDLPTPNYDEEMEHLARLGVKFTTSDRIDFSRAKK